MDFIVTEDDALGFRIVRSRGHLDLGDFADYIDWRDKQLGDRPVPPTLWDLRDLRLGEASAATVRASIGILQRFFLKREGGRSALLVRGAADFGIGRMFEMLADSFSHRYHVFDDEAEARAWLKAGDDQPSA